MCSLHRVVFSIYYIDMSVYCKIHHSQISYETTSGIRYLPYHSFVFPAKIDTFGDHFRLLFFSKHSYLCNTRKITRWLEHMKFIFSWKRRLHSFAALTRKICFPLEDKLHMFTPPCNILYISNMFSSFPFKQLLMLNIAIITLPTVLMCSRNKPVMLILHRSWCQLSKGEI